MTRAAFYAMLGPALALLLSTTYPFLSGIYTSLTNQKLYMPATKFVGLGNYITLFETPLFWTGLANTLTYAAAALFIQLPLGLASPSCSTCRAGCSPSSAPPWCCRCWYRRSSPASSGRR